MRIERLFVRKLVDCQKLKEFLESRYSEFDVKSESDVYVLQSVVEEKVLEDWVDPFKTINMDEVSKCLKDFIVKKSKKVMKRERWEVL
jgi:hypothetical protein